MGKRINKTTSVTVDITSILKEKGLQFPGDGFVELEVKVKHAKDPAAQYGTYIKPVTVDLTKKGDTPVQPVDPQIQGQ